MPFAGEHQRKKVPVTIITGFLGSGKTTLVNYLLQNKGHKRISVIENEYGEINVDRMLVQDNLLEKEDLVSLENGCACCSLRKDVVKAFVEIERRAKVRQKEVDAILLETTGLADPAPVAFTFFANPWIASRFKLDSIMCVVDARYLEQHLDDEKPEGVINEAVQQLAFSDLILLNKVDLVTPEQKVEVLKAIKKVNTTAKIIECQMNEPEKRPAITQLLGINSFSINRALEADPDFLASDSEDDEIRHSIPGPDLRLPSTVAAHVHEERPCTAAAAELAAAGPEGVGATAGEPSTSGIGPCSCASKRRLSEGCEAVHSEACSSPRHAEDMNDKRQPKRRKKKLHDLSDVTSVGITARGALDEYRFNMFMRDFLAEKCKDIFRCKGVLAIHGHGNQKFVFQGVHETICYGPATEPWKEDEEERVSQMVFIGKALDRHALTEGFRSCVWTPLPEGWEEAADPTTKRTYYYNKATGAKSWERPQDVCVYVVSKQKSTEQPPSVAPRRRPSFIVPNPAVAAGSGGSAAAAGVAARSGTGGGSVGDGGQQAAQPAMAQQVTTSA